MECLEGEIVALLQSKGYTFATAESCTGGAIVSAVTSVPGCSSVVMGGVVAYHNNVKRDLLGVRSETLEKYGAVSEEVVLEMVNGVSERLGASCAVATSGIAGPGGGTPEKPVGTVWVAVKVGERVVTHLLHIKDSGRARNVDTAVREVLLLLKGELLADRA